MVLELKFGVRHSDCDFINISRIIRDRHFHVFFNDVNDLLIFTGDLSADQMKIIENAISDPYHDYSFDEDSKIKYLVIERKRQLHHPPHKILLDNQIAITGPVKYFNGTEYYALLAPDSKCVSQMLAGFESKNYDVQIFATREGKAIKQKKFMYEGLPLTRILQNLTQNQLQTLSLAYEEGYFKVPKQVKTQDLADKLGITRQTFERNLNRAQEKLMDLLLPVLNLHNTSNTQIIPPWVENLLD